MKSLGAQPLEPLYVANTFTDALGDPSKHLVEIAEAEFLLSEIGEQGLDHTSPPSGTHRLVIERYYSSSDNLQKLDHHLGLVSASKITCPTRKERLI
jgi:hypothetical protein